MSAPGAGGRGVGGRRPRRRQAGFSLVELLTVVAIMGVLSVIATASYRRYVLRANRTDARLVLLAVQAGQEKYFLQNSQYAQDVATLVAAPPAGLGIGLSAAGLTPGGNYTIRFAIATPVAWQLQAVATGTQAQDDPACLVLAIDQSGNRTPADSTGCWN